MTQLEERKIKALESIARSLEQLVIQKNNVVGVLDDTGGGLPPTDPDHPPT